MKGFSVYLVNFINKWYIYVYTYRPTSTRYVARYCQYWLLCELLVIKNNIKTIENKIESIMPIEWIEYLSIYPSNKFSTTDHSRSNTKRLNE